MGAPGAVVVEVGIVIWNRVDHLDEKPVVIPSIMYSYVWPGVTFWSLWFEGLPLALKWIEPNVYPVGPRRRT